ncbi:uncharacterized protein LOC122526059 [Polistes fuscatus]|uniref:uncharacterized protein LOC122526059 n=1 Tax=Polistes fuscatus TaxID=30207 RepID=UPI001CA87A29|nr:uncharacterized protein LOC122526059 [Polistes fuscatus]
MTDDGFSVPPPPPSSLKKVPPHEVIEFHAKNLKTFRCFRENINKPLIVSAEHNDDLSSRSHIEARTIYRERVTVKSWNSYGATLSSPMCSGRYGTYYDLLADFHFTFIRLKASARSNTSAEDGNVILRYF